MARRREKNTNEIRAKRHTSSAVANFISVMMGMATTIAIGLWSWSSLSASANLKPVGPSSGSLGMLSNSPESEFNEFESLLASDDLPKMTNKLIALNDWPRNADLPIRVSENRKRVKLANRILTSHNLPQEDRVLAANALLDALSAIYGLDLFYWLKDENIGSELKTAADRFLDDPDAKLVRAAKLTLLKYQTFEYIKFKEVERIPLVEQAMTDVLKSYSNDSFGISNVKLIFKTLIQLDPKLAQRLTHQIGKQREDFAGTLAEELIADLTDDGLTLEANYSQLFGNRWVNGSAGRKQLLTKSLDLISNTDSGTSLIRTVDNVAQWFEQANKYDEASQIYTAMVETAKRPNRPEANQLATQLGAYGNKRCSVIGTPAEFSGIDMDGQPLTPERFSGKIVLLIFWSDADNNSVAKLTTIHREFDQFSSMPVEVVAINLNPSPVDAFTKFALRLPQFIFSDPRAGEPPLSQQCPVTVLPQIMLIDHAGKFADTNVRSEHLNSHLEKLVTLKSRAADR